MDFGDIGNVSNVNFEFKKPTFLSHKTDEVQKHWYLGCPVWSHKGMLKRLNKKSNDSHELQTYSRSFNSIELNSSYYSVPTTAQIEKWKSYTPSYFKFFPKAPKDLCFYSYDKIPQHVLDHYLRSLGDYGEKLEESFIQFSPYIGPSEKKYLFILLESLPADFKFSIELRHPDWFSNETQLKRLCEYLNKKDIGLVLTDTPGRRDVLPMVFTTNRAFIRFKGNNLEPTDYQRLDTWMKVLNESKSLKSIYFFHHHSDEQHCIDTIKHMKSLITEKPINTQCELDLKTDVQISLI